MVERSNVVYEELMLFFFRGDLETRLQVRECVNTSCATSLHQTSEEGVQSPGTLMRRTAWERHTLLEKSPS